MDEFYTFKKLKNSAVKWTRIDEATKANFQRRILTMIEFLVNPLLAYYSQKCTFREQFQVA